MNQLMDLLKRIKNTTLTRIRDIPVKTGRPKFTSIPFRSKLVWIRTKLITLRNFTLLKLALLLNHIHMRFITIKQDPKGYLKKSSDNLLQIAKAKKYRLLPLLIGLLIILGPMVYLTTKDPDTAGAGWWNDNWRYRQKVVINNESGSSQTDYQVKIDIDTEALITNDKLRNDCTDIRILDSNGAELSEPWWLDACNSDVSRIWIKFSTIPEYSLVYYVYYGNPNAAQSKTSDPEDIFLFFDGFSEATIDNSKWDQINSGTGSYSITDGDISITSSGDWWSTSDTSRIFVSKQEFTSDYAYEARIVDYSSVANSRSFGLRASSAANSRMVVYYGGSTLNVVERTSDGGGAAALGGSASYSEPSIAMWTRESQTHKGYTGNTLINTSSSIAGLDHVAITATHNGTNQIDYTLVRKFVASEPSATVNTEEPGPGPVGWWKLDEGKSTSLLRPLQKHETYINITNQKLRGSTYGGSFVTPTTTDEFSLGYVKWDGSKYDNETVYFEINGIIEQLGISCDEDGAGTAYLYDKAGNQITSMTLPECYRRVRSNALTLSDGTEYTARFSGLGSNEYFYNARLVVVQDSSEKLTNTQTQIEIGNAEVVSAGTFTTLTDKKIYYYDSSMFDPAPTAYFEAVFQPFEPKVEQHINMLNEQYYTTSGGPIPTDNSLGIIKWEGSKYNSEKVFFEASSYSPMSGPFCGSTHGWVDLYNTDGTLVTSIAIVECLNVLRRSSAVSLTDGDEYTVRVRGSGAGVTVYTARLVVIQNDDTKITDSQTHIPLTIGQSAISNSVAADLDFPIIYQYDQDQYSPVPESNGDIEFRATLKINDSSDSAHAQLYNITGSQPVSTLTLTSSTLWTLVSATNVDADSDWDTTNDDEYIVRVYCTDGGSDGCSGNIANAMIIINQSVPGGITDLETVHAQVMTAKSQASASYTSQGRVNEFSQFNHGTEPEVFYETTMKTSAGTGYGRVYDTEQQSVISNSEVTTTSTIFDRVRSSNIVSDLPFAARDMDTQIRNSSTNTTEISNSWFVVQYSNLPTSGPEGGVELYIKTDSASVPGSGVIPSSTGYNVVRSNAITLTTDKEYEVRASKSKLLNAKIILDQSNTSFGLVESEALLQMVSAVSTDSDTSYTDQDHQIYYDPTNFHVGHSDYFYEATIKAHTQTTGYTVLKNDTDGSAITNAELTTTAIDYERQRTASIKEDLPSTAKVMDTQIRNSSTDPTSVTASWMGIQNNNSITNIVHDSTKNENHGKLVNASWGLGSACRSGNCLDFDGSGDYFWMSDDSSLDFSTTDSFTLSVWFKRTGTISTAETLLSKYETTGSDGGYKLYMETDGDITCGVDTNNSGFPLDSVTSTSAAYNDGVWHNAVCIKNGSTDMTLYIDGELAGTDSSLTGSGTYANDDFLYVGIDNDITNGAFSGTIDEVKIYPYARTMSEVNTEHNLLSTVLGATATRTVEEGLVGWFKMEETTVDTCDGTNDNCDSSGKANHAAWNDNATYTTGKFGNALSLDGTNDRSVLSSADGVPANWFGTYSTRQPITLTNNVGSQLTDYQVRLEVTYDSDMQADFDDLRFTSGAGAVLDYWLESKTDSTSAVVWVEVDSIPASANTTIYMYYGDGSATSASSYTNTFINASIAHFTGDCTNGTYCSYMDNHSEADYIRENFAPLSSSYVTTILDATGGEQFFRRYRLLFIASTTGTHNFGVNTDDAGDMGIFPGDGYGGGENTAHPHGAHTVVATWYGGHGSGTCGSSGSPGSQSLTEGEGYWLDFIMNDWASGQYANACIQEPGGSYQTISTANFSGQIFARNYTSGSEPTYSFNTEETTTTTQTPISISAWVYADTLDAAQRNIIARGSSSPYEWFIGSSSTSAGKLIYTLDSETTTGTSNTTLSTSTWYHIALVSNGDIASLYINGTLDSQIDTGNKLPGSANISIGAGADGNAAWDGRIDDVRIFDKALSINEIQSLYKWSPGPVAYYTFDEGEGTTTVYDHSGNGYDGTMTGSMTESDWVRGKYGKGLDFDGSDDYINIGDISPFSFTDGSNDTPFSISAWVNMNDASPFDIAGKYGASGSREWVLGLDTSAHFYLRAFDSGDDYIGRLYNTSLVPNQGSWVYLTGVYDGTQTNSGFKLYMNGVRVDDTNTFNGTYNGMSDTDSDVNIGALASIPRYSNGIVDEVKIYNYERTQEQIISDMNAGHPIPGSPIGSPVGWWKFDEGYGDTAYDSSPSGNDGDLGNFQTCPGHSWCPTWRLEGKINKALNFDGVDNILVIGNVPELDGGGTSEWSVGTWFKPNSSSGATNNNKMIVAKWEGGGNQYLLGYYNDNTNTITYTVRTGSTGSGGTSQLVKSSTAVDDTNKWYHLFGVYDGSTVKLYIDGALNSSTQGTGNLNTSVTSNVVVGAYSTGNQKITGVIDEPKIYNFALTAAQVGSEYNQGKSLVFGATSTTAGGSAPSYSASREYCVPGSSDTCNAPIGSWLMDEGTGTTVYDTSDNNNNGTLTNSPIWSLNKCHSGKCIEMDGSNQFIDVGTGPTSVLSMEMWIKPETTTEYLLNLTGTSDYIWINSSTVTATNVSTPTIYVDGVETDYITADEWHQIVVTTDTPENATNIDIGRTADANYFQGIVDHVILYDYARTPAQIAWSYNRGQPLAHYKFDECQNSTANDSGPHGFNGTIIAGSGPNSSVGTCDSGAGDEMWDNGTTGKHGASLHFDNSDDRVEVTHDTKLNIDNSFSLAAWVNFESTTNPSYYVIEKGADGGTANYYMWWNNDATTPNDSMFCGFHDGAAYRDHSIPWSPSVGTWYHMACVFDNTGNDIQLYVNGRELLSEAENNSDPSTNAGELHIGQKRDGVGRFDGQLDEVMIFNYPMTPNQVESLHNRGSVRFD